MTDTHTEMCVHEQYRCAICDHRKEFFAELKAKEARKRKPKPATTGLPIRVDPFEKRMAEFASGARCMICEELKHDGHMCSCRRAAVIRTTTTEAIMFAASAPGATAKAALSTLGTQSYELGSSTRRVTQDVMESDTIRALTSALR